MRTLPLCLVLTACAPVRDEVPVGEGGGGDAFQSAVFLEWGQGAREYSIGAIHLVDAEYDCADAYNLEVDWWGLAQDVEWVSLTLLVGVERQGWEQEYPSYLSFERQGEFDYTDAVYFHGTYGSGGGSGQGDDDDVPPPVGRDVYGYLGQEQGQIDDTVTVSSFTDTRVSGSAAGTRTVDGEAEDYHFRFDAVNCGIVDGGVVIGR